MFNKNPKRIIKNMYKKDKKKVILHVVLVILIILFILIATFSILKKIFYPLKYFDIVKKEAEINNLDPYLVMSIIKTESNFNRYAISSKQAKGLMQIMDSTANDIKSSLGENIDISDIFAENTNIKLGCKYLASLINRYNGNYYLAICAYNAGMGNVDKWLEEKIVDTNLKEYKNVNIPFSQTKDYLYKVINSYEIYRRLYN